MEYNNCELQKNKKTEKINFINTHLLKNNLKKNIFFENHYRGYDFLDIVEFLNKQFMYLMLHDVLSKARMSPMQFICCPLSQTCFNYSLFSPFFSSPVRTFHNRNNQIKQIQFRSFLRRIFHYYQRLHILNTGSFLS